jgi:hypothetical protein
MIIIFSLFFKYLEDFLFARKVFSCYVFFNPLLINKINATQPNNYIHKGYLSTYTHLKSKEIYRKKVLIYFH